MQANDGQVTDPRGGPQAGRMAMSSASMPSVVAEMLTALDLASAENVTSIEIDPAVAEHARTALSATGHGAVTVITGDGAHGHPDGAPAIRGTALVLAAVLINVGIASLDRLDPRAPT